MAKGYNISFPHGGKTKMHGAQHAGPSMAGVSYGKSGDGGKFPMGGKTKMHSKQTASCCVAGRTGK